MPDVLTGCGCCGGCGCAHCCGTFPPEFVRLRYFFGQRLGVVDFSDEQSYLVGKQRFANRMQHGAGVLCGLRVERFVFPQGSPPATPTTVIRLFRGAAIDSCGREIVVGTDQCIDVNAWFQANRTRPEIAAWVLPGSFRLCVGLRYRDCPADPAPAPRDPCGCDSGGCEFGRVRESFELALLTESQQPDCHFTLSPTLADIQREQAALQAANPLLVPGPAALLAAAHRAVAAGCQDASATTWLCLACLDVAINAAGVVTDVTAVDNFGADRRSLLPVHTLQEMLIGSGGAPAGGSSGGPAISGITFVGSGLTNGQFRLAIQLGQSGTPPASTPLAAATVASSVAQLSRFDAATGWTAQAQSGFNYDPTATPPMIVVRYSTLAAEARYRLYVASPPAQPVVDERMRPLTPADFAIQFRLVDTGGTLTIAGSLF